MAACPACAADAALERALVKAAPGSRLQTPGSGLEPGAWSREHERSELWARIARVTFEASDLSAVRCSGLRAGGPYRLRPLRLAFAMAPLVAAILLAGQLARVAGKPAVPFQPDRGWTVSLGQTLWEAQPSAADPMGPTTQGLLVLLEGES